MSDWMTIRVVLLGQPDAPLRPPPGRILLTHADHTFSDMAEAVDVAFARWDLTPAHRFDVEGRVLMAEGDADEGDLDAEDSEDVTVGEVGLRVGSRFTYLFDLGERWEHECTVETTAVDPFELAGDEPETPAAIFGWGTIPDQYGRTTEDDEEEGLLERDELEQAGEELDSELDDDAELVDLEDVEDDELLWEEQADARGDGTGGEDVWEEPDPSTWSVVAEAIRGIDRHEDVQALTAATAELRDRADEDQFPYGVLWELADLDEDDLPATDQELWLEVASAVIVPAEGVPDVAAPEPWSALEPADWAGAVIELVRAGEGTPADADALLDLIARCPEVESEDLSDEDREVLRQALTTVVRLWQALGAVDEEARLTRLGLWGLPEALRIAWS